MRNWERRLHLFKWHQQRYMRVVFGSSIFNYRNCNWHILLQDKLREINGGDVPQITSRQELLNQLPNIRNRSFFRCFFLLTVSNCIVTITYIYFIYLFIWKLTLYRYETICWLLGVSRCKECFLLSHLDKLE